MRSLLWLFVGLSVAAPADAQTFGLFGNRLHVYATSSMSGPMQELIAASGLDPDDVAKPVFGPSGTLRAEIEAGAPAALFMSADLDQPKRLETRPGALPAVAFATNRVCVLAPQAAGLRSADLLDRMLDPKLRLATGAPGDSAIGDYAFAMFSRADAIRAGAGAALSAKVRRLLSASGVDGHSAAATVFLRHEADALIDFCSLETSLRSEVPNLVAIPLPAALAIVPIYGLVVLRPTRIAMRLALFMLSAKGQSILADAGLVPLSCSSTDLSRDLQPIGPAPPDRGPTERICRRARGRRRSAYYDISVGADSSLMRIQGRDTATG